MRLFKNWDKEEKASAVRILGLVMAALTVFMLIASVSYLFHWKQDMSLLAGADASDAGQTVGNAAGRLGFRTGYLLVCELFGMGSFCLLLILGAVTVRLLLHRWRRSLVKTALIALFGAFISSLLFAYCGRLAGLDDIFGGGLGGRCGALTVQWAEGLFGTIVTGFFIVILIAAFLFFSSRRFNCWFASLGEGGGKKERGRRRAAKGTDSGNKEAEEGAPEEPEEPEDPTDEDEPEDEDTGKTVEAGGATAETEGAGEDFRIITDNTLNAEVTQQLQPIDNRLDPPDGLPKYEFPSIDLLKDYKSARREVSTEELTRNNNKIRAALANYKIQVTDVKAVVGPTVTLYKVNPAPGVKIAEIKKLQEDIALSLNAKGVRVTTLSDAVGIEVANDYSSSTTTPSARARPNCPWR